MSLLQRFFKNQLLYISTLNLRSDPERQAGSLLNQFACLLALVADHGNL
jgi:hypothetical protein